MRPGWPVGMMQTGFGECHVGRAALDEKRTQRVLFHKENRLSKARRGLGFLFRSLMHEILFPPFPYQQHQINKNQQSDAADSKEIHSKKIYTFGALYHDGLYEKI
jgi:hypothetical protein